MQNRVMRYVRMPEYPYKGAAASFELQPDAMPEVKEGMILASPVCISIAPSTRCFLELPGNDVQAEELGLNRTKEGEVVPVEMVAMIVESKSKKYKVGDRIFCPRQPLCQFFALREDGKDDKDGVAPIKVPSFVKSETMFTVSPASGGSAYCAINDHECGSVDDAGLMGCFRGCFGKSSARRKTVLVTSAAGAVGIVACQLYKLKGCKVIGVTSTREKADKLLEYGCDHGIAYKTEDLDKRLTEVAPEGFDVFFDNVGATQLDIGTRHMKIRGKILSMGIVSEVDRYCADELQGWKEYKRMVARELRVGGFLVLNHIKKLPMATLNLSMMIQRGKLKPCHTIINGSLDDWTSCVDKLFDGQTFGRMVLKLDDPKFGS